MRFQRTLLAWSWLAIFATSPTLGHVVQHTRRAPIADGVKLRVLPLGDSITHGYKSSDDNGYRRQLWNSLSENEKDFVGTQPIGNMPDPDNEGYNGALIAEIASYSDTALNMRPNVVLIHAGTNDMNRPHDPDTAPVRLGALIDKVISNCPDAAILVAKIVPASNSDTMARINTFNNAVPGVVSARAQSGHKVMVVDMTTLTTADLADGLHPTNAGYDKMGHIWYSAIVEAGGKGWIEDPVPGAVGGGGAGACSNEPVWYPQGEIASGIGSSEAFTSVWHAKGEIASGIGPGNKVRFGDLDGDGRDDYLFVYNDGTVVAYLNTVGSSADEVVWIPKDEIASGIGKDGAGVRFADMNGDGRDDYLWVSEDGRVTCYLNGGGEDPGKPVWHPQGEIASGVGATRDRVLFGDIDGDGRDDYLVVTDNGGLQAWLNTGTGDKPVWVAQGEIASGIGAAEGVRIADVNKDGRADYLWVSEDGRVTLFTNLQGKDPGHPAWWPQGEIASGVGASRENITFADINGDGRSDYLVIGGNGEVTEWQNGGNGGQSQIGPGVVFHDLNADGRDDYLAVDDNGKIIAYVNGGVIDGKQIWYPQGEIASGVGAKRHQVRFGDMDGDGRAEYLVVHDDGAVESWRNVGAADNAYPGRVTWVPQGTIATGIGKDGNGVRFADLNGDGRDDYLYVDPNGAVTAYLNGGGDDPGHPIWFPQGVIATGVGGKGADVHFADVNGDGRAEYLWISPDDGSVQCWFNAGSPEGNNGPNGGKVVWVPWGTIATGVGTDGSRIKFGDLNGDGRADYLAVSPGNGAVSEWQNGCDPSHDGGGDNGEEPIKDPAHFCEDNEAGTANAWEAFETDNYLRSWWDTHPDQTNLAVNFGKDWGLGESFRCGIPTFCRAPLCHTLRPQNNDTADGWMVLESFQNLNQFLVKLRDALWLSNTQYSTLQVAIEQDFDPGSSAKELAAIEALSASTVIVGILTAWMGPTAAGDGIKAAVGTFKEMFAGAARSVTATLQASDISLSNIAQEEEAMHSFFGINMHVLDNMNSDLMARGKYSAEGSQEANIVDMFAGGYWVNYKQIPPLNIDDAFDQITQRELSDWLFKVVLGNLVNSIWKKQGVWITAIPMTQEECESNQPGNGDFRLKLCQDGKGYFLQRIFNKKGAFGDDWQAILPEFWGDMEEKYGISPWDAMKSSIAAFNEGGFDFKPDSLIGNILETRGPQNIDAFASFPGIFSLPVCDFATSPWGKDLDLEGYMEWIDKPGVSYTNDVGLGGNCGCRRAVDKNGKSFADFYPENPTC